MAGHNLLAGQKLNELRIQILTIQIQIFTRKSALKMPT